MSKFRIDYFWCILFVGLFFWVQSPFVVAETTTTNVSEDNDEEEDTEDEEDTEEEEADTEDSEDSSNIEVVFEKIASYEEQAPAFSVKLRKESKLESFPCMDCHEDEEANSQIRELEDEHDDITLEHGGERFWCLTCHDFKNRDYLTSLKKNAIDFDASYRVCGQCHFQRQKDWFFGGHGKRVGNWQGNRQLYLCTECHNPHSPSIKPIKPNPPPKVRSGLVYVPSVGHKKAKIWEKYSTDITKEKHD